MNTLIIIESTLGNIFGGYTEVAWHSNNECVQDFNSFLFSLVNKDNKPFKAPKTQPDFNSVFYGAIVNYLSCGPVF